MFCHRHETDSRYYLLCWSRIVDEISLCGWTVWRGSGLLAFKLCAGVGILHPGRRGFSLCRGLSPGLFVTRCEERIKDDTTKVDQGGYDQYMLPLLRRFFGMLEELPWAIMKYRFQVASRIALLLLSIGIWISFQSSLKSHQRRSGSLKSEDEWESRITRKWNQLWYVKRKRNESKEG